MNKYRLITWLWNREDRSQAGFVSAENIAYAVVGVLIVFALFTLFRDNLLDIGQKFLDQIYNQS